MTALLARLRAGHPDDADDQAAVPPEMSIPELAALVDRIAEATGDPAVKRASRALRQLPGGRPPLDDEAALDEAEDLLRRGKVRSERDALMRVSAARTTHGSLRTTYERLRRKLSDRKK